MTEVLSTNFNKENTMHVDDQVLSSYIDNELSEPWKAQVEEHLDWCEACRLRADKLRALHNKVQAAGLTNEDIERRQDRVFKYINNNVIHKKRFSIKRFFKKIPKMIFYPVLTACLTFCFCLIIFHPGSKKNDIVSLDPPMTISIDSIVPVRSSDNYTTSESLSKYSLDDILKYLDEKGYEVDLKLKPLTTLPEGKVIISDTSSLKLTAPIFTVSEVVFPLKINNPFLFKASY